MAILALLLCLLLASCGGAPPTTPPPPPNPNTFTLTSTGVSPKELTVAPGSQVRFVNNDSRPHFMASDPHPEHQDCPEINAVGLLGPGQSRETLNLVMVRTCGFHDHDNPPLSVRTGNMWTGRIIVR
jgi:hypothetical protein